MSRQNRPSPSISATTQPVGTVMIGNDGRNWYVVQNSNGVQRWFPVGTTSFFNRILSKTTPTTVSVLSKKAKFKVGDTVKIVDSGWGCDKKEVGKIVEITEVGLYDDESIGYKVNPPHGNTLYGHYNGYINELSFELVEESKIEKQSLKKEQLNKVYKMAKATKKTITKRTAQEVRNIETSLINKEEVFKMLALAEATGLPCLLIGEPGVNLN